MALTIVLASALLLSSSVHSLHGPGRDPCKITGNGFGLTCSNITKNFFTSSMFFSLDDDIARFTGEVKRFEVHQSNITDLVKGSFKYMPHLAYIVLSNVSLREIDRGAFEGLESLKMVDLSLNELQEMPVRAFKDTPISHLTVEGNHGIRVPTNGPILVAKRLRSLVLRRCSLRHLSGSAFTEVLALTHLDLSGNRLEMLPKAVLAPLEYLDFIDLSGNRFATIDFQIFTLLPPYPNNPSVVVLAGNPWSCDCRISGLLQWVTKNGNIWTDNATLSRLRKRTECRGPGEWAGVSWNDSRLRQHLLAC